MGKRILTMVESGFVLLFGGGLIGLSLFMAIYLWIDDKTSSIRLKQKLLSLFLLGLALRVSKASVGVFFGIDELLGGFGLVGTLIMGPAIFLGLSTSKNIGQRWIHFLPALMLLFSMRFVDLSHTSLSLFYLFIFTNIHFGAYIFLLSRDLKLSGLLRGELLKRNGNWPLIFTLGLSGLWFLFVFAGISFLFIEAAYLDLVWSLSGFMEMVVFYVLCIVGTKHIKFILKPKLDFEKLGQLQEIAEKSRRIIETEKLYKNEDVSLSVVASKVGTSPHILSGAINDYLNMSFSDWINHYRVSHSAELLRDKSNNHIKLEAIAFESGFSTVSVFYRNFKKIHKLTPTEYRKRYA